jgi:hypothetical protein
LRVALGCIGQRPDFVKLAMRLKMRKVTKGARFRLLTPTYGCGSADASSRTILLPKNSVIEVLTGEENRELWLKWSGKAAAEDAVHLGELNSSTQARWLKTVEVFNEQGEAQQLKLFPAHGEVPEGDPQVARAGLNKVRLERTRQFGACWLGLELWKKLELDRFFAAAVDPELADVPWSRVAALLAIHRLCAPGSELAVEQHWYPSTAWDDLLSIEEGKINDTRLYRCLDRPFLLPHGKGSAGSGEDHRHRAAEGSPQNGAAFCRTRPNWNGIGNSVTESCSGPNSTCCCTI